MALVSLDTAKHHLRIPLDATDHDADVVAKLTQAEGIILDYLKYRVTNIESVSVANPTVITTDGPHSLVTGATHTIAGTTSTPTVNGAQVVTVASSTTFTVPVNVTVGQADAAGTVSSAVWTEATVPGPVQSAVLIMLMNLYENRGDDESFGMSGKSDAVWAAIEKLLARQRDPALA